MEEQTFVTREELNKFNKKLDEFIRQVQGIKSTIEILQDKEMMQDIKESEELEREGLDPVKIKVPIHQSL